MDEEESQQTLIAPEDAEEIRTVVVVAAETKEEVKVAEEAVKVVEEEKEKVEEVVEPEPIPLYSWREIHEEGQVLPKRTYLTSRTQVDEMVAKLKGYVCLSHFAAFKDSSIYSPIGFDMEWKVDMRRGAPQYKTALVGFLSFFGPFMDTSS